MSLDIQPSVPSKKPRHVMRCTVQHSAAPGAGHGATLPLGCGVYCLYLVPADSMLIRKINQVSIEFGAAKNAPKLSHPLEQWTFCTSDYKQRLNFKSYTVKNLPVG